MSEICICKCHEFESYIAHIRQCCHTCEKCKQRIIFHQFEEHIKKCNK